MWIHLLPDHSASCREKLLNHWIFGLCLKQFIKYSCYGIIFALMLFILYFCTYGILDTSSIYLFIVGLGALIGFLKGINSGEGSENRTYYGSVIDIAVTTINYMIVGFILALLLFYLGTRDLTGAAAGNGGFLLILFPVFTVLGGLIGLFKGLSKKSDESVKNGNKSGEL